MTSSAKRVGSYIYGLAMVVMGVLHFMLTDQFAAIVPSWLPNPTLLVEASGIAELAIGLGLMGERSRKPAAWALIALLIAVFPANIWMATHKIYTDNPVILWGRLPFQAVFIGLAYLLTR